MNTRRHVSTAVATLFAIVVLTFQLLSSIDDASYLTPFLLTLVMLAAAAFTRKRAIGGWLLCCYFVVAGFATWFGSLLNLVEPFLDATRWPSPYAHLAFAALTLATYALTAAVIWSMLLLLVARNEKQLTKTRHTLLVAALVSICAYLFVRLVAVDTVTVGIFSPMPFGVAIASGCLSLYLRYSQRVRRVFVENSWPLGDAVAGRPRPSSPTDR